MVNIGETLAGGMKPMSDAASQIGDVGEKIGQAIEQFAQMAEILGNNSGSGDPSMLDSSSEASDPLSNLVELIKMLAQGGEDPSSSVDTGTMAAQSGVTPPMMLQ